MEIELRNDFNSSNVVAILNPDFTKRVYTLDHYTVGDAFKEVGSYQSAIVPIVGIYLPLLFLWFLYLIAGIIFEKNQDQNVPMFESIRTNMVMSFREAYSYLKTQNRQDLLSGVIVKKLKKTERLTIEEMIELNSEINSVLATSDSKDRQCDLVKTILAEVSAQ